MLEGRLVFLLLLRFLINILNYFLIITVTVPAFPVNHYL